MAPTTVTKGPAPGRGRNRWTHEQRTCLCMLFSGSFDIPTKDRATVFNTIFKDDLDSYGLPDGLELSSLRCQYHERTHRHKSSWSKTWETACSEPATAEEHALRDQMRTKIRAAVQSLQSGNAIEVAMPSTPIRPLPQQSSSQSRTGSASHSTLSKHTQMRITRDPYATPGPSTQKRAAATPVALDDEHSDNDTDDGEYVMITKKRKHSPIVVIPPTPESISRPSRASATPQAARTNQVARYRSGGRPGATELLLRMNSSSIWLTPDEFAQAQLPLQNVSEADAHPTPSPLLFRYWHDRSHGRNSSNGFVSGRHANALVPPRPPPSCDNIEWNDITQHLNNAGMDQTGSPSPFVSTSNLLVWTIRVAMKRADPSTHISVINTSKLDPRLIYHVAPFYKELKKKRPFYRGGFNYTGTYEYLIWYQIPASAIIKTFSLAEITTFASTSRGLRRVLRLDQLASVKSGAAEIIKSFKQDDVKITGRVANAIGETIIFLGLHHASSREALARAVFEIAQGWAIKADGSSNEHVERFVQAFSQKNNGIITIADHLKLTHAFLDGIFTSHGDLNLHNKGPQAYNLMKSRAHKRGLTNPDELMRSELNREKINVEVYNRRQQRLLGGIEEDDEGEDAVVDGMPGHMAQLELDENIIYEEE